MLMKTFKLILKTFFRTKFLSITTILFFIGISAYQIFIELAVPHLSGITMLSYYFQFSLVLFAVFMLLSYEFFIKIKKDKAQECLCAINNGNIKIVFYQFVVMMLINAIAEILFFLIIAIGCMMSGLSYPSLYLHIFLAIFLYSFLTNMVAILIGLAVSLNFERTIAYIALLLCSCLASYYPTKFLVDSSLYKFFDFFNLTIDPSFAENNNFGYSLLEYKWFKVFFWILMCLSIIYFSLYKNRPKKLYKRCLACIFLACVTLGTYCLPSSKVDFSEYYGRQEMQYYDEHKGKHEAADFEIVSYDIDLKIGRNLKAKVIMTVNNPDLSEYKFTLYHGYKISNITDENENKLSYMVDSDYFTVKNNEQKLSKIIVEYTGSSMKNYANRQGVFLSGTIEYYPHAGFSDLSSIENEKDFTVRISGKSNIYSNLKETEKGLFKGRVNEATFISGLIACEEYNGIKYIYPYCSTSQLPEFGQGIKNESNNLINSPLWDKKIDTVIMIPFHPDFAVSRIPIYGNIMELKYLDRLRFQYDLFKIDSSKTELYESGYYLIIDDIKNFEKNVERNMDMYVGDLNSLVEKYGKEKVREELNKYIYDNANTSTPEEFLNSLRSETNA